MSFSKCRNCGEYDYTPSHTCKPGYLVWPEDGGEEDFPKMIHAVDFQDAAEKYANYDDQHSADYMIVGGQDAIVFVKGGGITKKFSVSGQQVREYSASEIE
jgi:hypothetical protein